MDSKTFKSKSAADLTTDLNDLRKEQFNLRMQRGTGQLTQTHQIRLVRRDIARIKTALAAKK